MKKDHFSRVNGLDASITELIQNVQQHRNMAGEPEMRMTDDIRRAYQAEVDEDARSLERVLSRLVDEDAPEQPKIIFLSRIHQKQERMSSMQQNTTDSSAASAAKKPKSRLMRRVGMLAAVLCMLALVGGFLTILNEAHTKPASSTTGSHNTANTVNTTAAPAIKSGPVGTIVYKGGTYAQPMSWSLQGNRVAGLSSDGLTPASWDGLTGGNVVLYHLPFKNGSSALLATAWSPNGNSVAFAYTNGITVFNARSGAVLRYWLPKQSNSFQSLSWSPNGQYLVTNTINVNGTTVQSALVVFDPANGQIVAQPASGVYSTLAWSPDGKYLAAGSVSEAPGLGSSWVLWSPANWKIARTYSNVADLSWSPDGPQMALVKNGSVQIVNAASGSVVRSFAGADGKGAIAAVAWQPHGTRVLVLTVNASAQISSLSLWDARNGTHLYTFKDYQGAFIDATAWSSDGKYVMMSAFHKFTLPPLPTKAVGAWYEVIWIAE